ncbi:MAG: YggT family protein [Mariprofundus sp.]|nr:YggT family protein [Mariprofundus sp.]
MFVMGYFLQALSSVLHIIFMTATIIVIARAVLSWVSPDPYNPIVRIINQLSEPLLSMVRKYVPMIAGIDFSPLIALLMIMFLDNFVVATLNRIAIPMIQGG